MQRGKDGLIRFERTLLVVPHLKKGENRALEPRLEEATGLCEAIDLVVAKKSVFVISEIRPASYIGKGKIDELSQIIVEKDIVLAVFDCSLTPVQQRNLETELKCKVIDRTGLILEIFGRRAKTNEGVLQVELAALNYQKSRLVRSWTHLERQRGGFGFLGGPGETQIEADRRVINERISKIERDIQTVVKTRRLHRSGRKRVPYPIVALVGYTNAGKSTLFNALTNADVLAKDMLFATLDPTLRAVKLPTGVNIIFSDTVGFIADLPTQLIAAFRATLEEVLEADVILHIRDIASDESEAQAQNVREILLGLGVESDDERLIEVWNKSDLLDPERRRDFALETQEFNPRPILISALNMTGFEILRAGIEAKIAKKQQLRQLLIKSSDGALLNWLYENTDVLSREDIIKNGLSRLTVRLSQENSRRLNEWI